MHTYQSSISAEPAPGRAVEAPVATVDKKVKETKTRKVSKPKLTAEEEAELEKAKVRAMMDKEEAWMSSQIYAACRVHWAFFSIQHVTTLFEKKMVKRWTGLNRRGASAMVANYDFGPFPCDEDGRFVEQEVKDHRGVMLTMLLEAIILLATAAGTTSGVAKDLRELCVFHFDGFVQPLGATEEKEVDQTFWAFRDATALVSIAGMGGREELENLQRALKNCAAFLPRALRWGGLSRRWRLSRFSHPLLHRTWDSMELRAECAKSTAGYVPPVLRKIGRCKTRAEEETLDLVQHCVEQMVRGMFIGAMWDMADALVDAIGIAQKIAQWEPKTFSSRLRGCVPWSTKDKGSEDARELHEAMILCEETANLIRAAKLSLEEGGKKSLDV